MFNQTCIFIYPLICSQKLWSTGFLCTLGVVSGTLIDKVSWAWLERNMYSIGQLKPEHTPTSFQGKMLAILICLLVNSLHNRACVKAEGPVFGSVRRDITSHIRAWKKLCRRITFQHRTTLLLALPLLLPSLYPLQFSENLGPKRKKRKIA